MAFDITDLRPRIGAEIKTAPDELMRPERPAELRRLLEERGVIVFPQLGLDDAQQLAFACSLGEVLNSPEGDPVYRISFEEGRSSIAKYARGTFVWHIDRADQDVPSWASILCAKRLAESGGATEFANTYAAYEDLPESEKTRLEGLRVVHSVEHGMRVAAEMDGGPDLVARRVAEPKLHPLVWTHRSGRKSLVLGSTASHVEGMGESEGRALLQALLEWATQPRFVYRHEWRVGDVLMWDNTGTMHRVEPYATDSGRLMHRTTLVGEEPIH